MHVADLVALIERLRRSPVDLLGHSCGGVVAWLQAQSCPGGEEYVRGLAASRARTRAKIDSGQDPVSIVRAMYDDARPGTFDSFPEWRRQAQRIAMPVLLVEGQKTSPGMRAIGTRLLECLPDSRRAVLPGVGHTIQFDAPEVMAVVVADFLARWGRPAKGPRRGPRPDGAFTRGVLTRFR